MHKDEVVLNSAQGLGVDKAIVRHLALEIPLYIFDIFEKQPNFS
jgi:hypothetical protein